MSGNCAAIAEPSSHALLTDLIRRLTNRRYLHKQQQQSRLQQEPQLLDPVLVGRLKQLCRQEPALAAPAVELCLKQVAGGRPMRVRVASVRVMDVLFSRWHQFRVHLLDSVCELLQLCLRPASSEGATSDTELSTALLTVLYRWQCEYASRGYKQLDRIATFVHKKYGMELDQFRDIPVLPTPPAATTTSCSRSDRQLQLLRHQLDSCRADMSDALAQAESCFQLLLPELSGFIDDKLQPGQPGNRKDEEGEERMEDEGDDRMEDEEGETATQCEPDDGGDSGEADEGTGGCEWRAHGLLSGSSCQVPVSVQPLIVRLTEDNRAVIDALRDSVSMISKRFLPSVDCWIKRSEQITGGCQEFANQLRAIRACLQSIIDRRDLLTFVSRNVVDSAEEDDEDTSDFLEVAPELDLLTLPVPSARAEEASTCSEGASAASSSSGPVCVNGVIPRDLAAGADSVQDGESASADGDECLLQRAVSADGDECLLQRTLSAGRVSLRVFRTPGPQLQAAGSDCQRAGTWQGCSVRDDDSGTHSVPVPVVVHVDRRTEPVPHTCGARLPSGRLCPRADRARCPLHGPIVARDAQGLPLEPGLRRAEWERRVRGDEHGDWQDPRLLAALKESTGVDLTVGGRGRGRRPSNSTRGSTRSRLASRLLGRRHTSASADNLRRFRALMRAS